MENMFTNSPFFPIAIGFKKKLLLNLMKSFLFLFCTTVFGFSSGNILSQNAKVKIDTDKTITVDEVFKIIKSYNTKLQHGRKGTYYKN